ncbi:thiol peroxidase [Desulfonatronospira sp.]|uniref:thiol peroxidase n=1 Tax=Desulfonatronospira sp. TaxID=1962951 RepID=UPI0025C1FB55|nr:thiol peroxidase [Desulfonatronospira sp.]
MNERQGIVTLHQNPLTLVGEEPAIDRQAPDFEVLDNELNPFRLSSLKDRVIIIASVPSLDTPVCDMEVRRFNQEAASLHEDISILTISMDLPFAQKRWCAAAGVDKVQTLSDHRDVSFGVSYGVLIKELRLLARAMFVVDRTGILKYIEIVPEVTGEPDYKAVLESASSLL